jgi:hypothetical protein
MVTKRKIAWSARSTNNGYIRRDPLTHRMTLPNREQIPLTPPKTSLEVRIDIDMGRKRRETCQTKGQDIPLIEIKEFPPTWLMDIELVTEDNRTPENATGQHDVKLAQNNVPETNVECEGPNPATRLLETAESVSTSINGTSIYETKVATRFSPSQEPDSENDFDSSTPHERVVEEGNRLVLRNETAETKNVPSQYHLSEPVGNKPEESHHPRCLG